MKLAELWKAAPISEKAPFLQSAKESLAVFKKQQKIADKSNEHQISEFFSAVPTPVLEPVMGELCYVDKSHWELQCKLCNLKQGACMECSIPDCNTCFHPTCAADAGLHMVTAADCRGCTERIISWSIDLSI